MSVIAAYDNTLPKGKVTDSIACKDNSQNFALYLPSYYTPGKPFPCIYFFDAHAHGAMPLNMYKEIAERYGFVCIGSNMSKNGTAWDVTNDGIKALMVDTRGRINIDAKRIYTAGFSGGSRVASSVAILDGGIAGVIGCAAGFPHADQPFATHFSYFGMVGEYDFNLTEMQQLDGALQQNSFSHQLLTFDGIHGWAPAADFQTALLWMQVNAIRNSLQTKNDTLIIALKADYDKRIAAAKSAHDLIKQQQLLDGAAQVSNTLADVAPYQQQLTALTTADDYKKAIALQAQLRQTEQQTQQKLQQQFTAHDEKWWTAKIAELNKNSHTAKTQQEAHMYRRLVNYLGLICYLNADHALKTGDLDHAITYINIFKSADPKNPDHSYLAAIYYIKEGNTPQALTALNDAATLGYSDISTMLTDPSFSTLQNDPTFKKILQKVAAKAEK